MKSPLLCLALFAPLALSAASPDGQPLGSPYLYRWSFEAGGLSESEFREGVSGGELTVGGGDPDGVPVFQRRGGVSEMTPGVLSASRNHYGSANGAQVNSFGSPLRTSHTLSRFTVTMWIKPTLPANKQPLARLLNLGPDQNEQATKGILLALDNDSFSFSVNGSPSNKVELTESVVKTDEWVFLVFCYDGLAGPYWSPDLMGAMGWSEASPNAAILAGDLTRPTRLISKYPLSTGGPAYDVSPGAVSLDGLMVAVGSSNSRYDRAFVGWIDDVRIYDGLLSVAELERVRLEATAPLAAPLAWTTTAPLIQATPDERHPIVAVKDPTVVFRDGRWHMVATTASTKGWRMAYLNFTSWDQAGEAKLVSLEDNPHFTGHYNCAPHVFYFRPHNKWYLIFQSQQPRFSTTDNITDVMSWSKPQDFFVGTPKSVVDGWIDYWIICDDTHAYLFFSDNKGRFYRSRTRIEDFPRGFDEPVIAMQEANGMDLFEGASVYRIKGANQFLCLVECADKNWNRYFRAFTADRLDGEWKPLPGADSATSPFAGNPNVRAEPGATVWANGISHGELLRVGSDETMTIDPKNLQMLYQGIPPGTTASEYLLLPYRLALLKAAPATP